MKRIARTAAPIIAAVALVAALSGSALAVSKTTPVPYKTTQPVPLALAGDQVAFKHIEPVPAPRI